jgi:hypothetical protein
MVRFWIASLALRALAMTGCFDYVTNPSNLRCQGVDCPIKSGDDGVCETPMAQIKKSFLLLFIKKEALAYFPPRPCAESGDGIQRWDGYATCARRYQQPDRQELGLARGG